MLMFADCYSMRLCKDVNDDVAVTIQIVRTEESWTGSNLPTHSGLTNHRLATSLLWRIWDLVMSPQMHHCHPLLSNAKNHYFREVKQSVCSLRILRSGSCFKKCNLTRCIFEWCASTIKFVLQPLTIKINMKCKLISTFFVQIEWDFIITISTMTTTIISTMTTIIIPSSSMITSVICFTIVMLISKPEVVECKDKRYEIREQTRSVY